MRAEPTAPRSPDLDDTIVGVGEVSGEATRIIDASGRIVTSGFVDLHTHMDAQAAWDPSISPCSNHGVTSALIGNCGVTFAPCKPEDRSFLAKMMETVEDIPADIILEGMPWDWESFGEYLDSMHSCGHREVTALANAAHGAGGIAQVVPCIEDVDDDRELVRAITQDAGARLLFSSVAGHAKRVGGDLDALWAEGGDITGERSGCEL